MTPFRHPGEIANLYGGMSVSVQELDNTVRAFFEGKGDVVGVFFFCFSRIVLLDWYRGF